MLLLSLFLVSCGQKNLDTIVITPETPIENKDQAAKVCEPFIQYINCSIEKAPEAKKLGLQNALKEIQRKIDNDEPAIVAQECNLYIERLNDSPGLAFKNGCTAQSVYAKPSVNNSTETPVAPSEPKDTAAQV